MPEQSSDQSTTYSLPPPEEREPLPIEWRRMTKAEQRITERALRRSLRIIDQGECICD